MSSLIKRVVFANHFKPFTKESKIPAVDRYHIELMIDYVENGVHPIKSTSKEVIQRIREYTGVDVSTLNIEGIDTPSQDEMFSEENLENDQNKNSIPHNPSDSTCCKYYSLNENLSSEYNFANPVDIATCSHPKSYFGINCIAGIKHHQCPHYVEDTGHYADVINENNEVIFKTTYQRTVMGNVHIYITNKDNYLIHTLSYQANDHQSIPRDEFNSDLLAILSDINNMSLNSVSKLSISFSEEQKASKSSFSYISTLIPEMA